MLFQDAKWAWELKKKKKEGGGLGGGGGLDILIPSALN